MQEKEEKPPRRRSRHRSLSRNRSRSRSWDRTRRSRSREKSRDRDHAARLDREKRERARAWRNKSPPRRYERRRSRSATPSRIRSRSRSPRHPYRGRYRNRSPPGSTSRSLSRSAERKERKDSKSEKETKENQSGAGTPTQDSNHGDMDLRLTNTTQSIQSVIVQQNPNENRNLKRRCRDYDEKGYCMRGEMCPFDHGVDPVVLEDAALTRVLTYAPNGAPVPEVNPPILNPPIIGGPGPHPLLHPINQRALPPEYNPQAPQMWHRPGFRPPRPPIMSGPRVSRLRFETFRAKSRLPSAFQVPPMNLFPPQSNSMQRELISVPVLDNQTEFGSNFRPQNDHESDMSGGFKKKGFDFNRLGPRNKNPANCSLELKKVPPGLNNIMHLNNHFSKFGKIVNIQVFYEGDPEAAIVTFSSHAEANAAYRSTEAVLNNRFIKVFWHSPSSDGKKTLSPLNSSQRPLFFFPLFQPANKKTSLHVPLKTAWVSQRRSLRIRTKFSIWCSPKQKTTATKSKTATKTPPTSRKKK